MKAAVLRQFGAAPKYEDYTDPVPQNTDQLILNVTAAAVKNIDKLRASGTHYASYKQLPAIVGLDGVGKLQDGTRVYAMGIAGIIAEKALIQKGNYTPLPDSIDDVTAAALPNGVIGAAMALLYRAHMKKGEAVLINGATGVTGLLAVQLAKHYGASRIITTGRNATLLEQTKKLGATDTISLHQDAEAIIKQIKDIHAATPIDIVIDYLWGKPVEMIITALKGGGVNSFTPRVRIVTVGEMAGPVINLPSGILRSSAIEILGSGIGSISKEAIVEFNTKVLPEVFKLSAEGKIHMDTVTAPLTEIEKAWNMDPGPGKRLVITI